MEKPSQLAGLIKDFVPREDKEAMERARVAEVVFEGLYNAYKNHRELGEEGKLKDTPNQFEEMAIRADIEAEEQILRALSTWAEREGTKLCYRGEELGEGEIGTEWGEPYFAVFDGLDGSKNFQNVRPWPYGTMVAVAKGESPTYDDFEVAGIAMHEEGWVVLGIKNAGVFLVDIKNRKLLKLPKFKDEDYEKERILADNPFTEAQEILGDFQDLWPRTGSTAASIVAIVTGEIIKDKKFPDMNKGWQGMFEVTRKKNLEQPTIFRLISERGGVMEDGGGESIGNYDYLSWEQDSSKPKRPIITAKSKAIADAIRADLGLTNRKSRG